MSDDKRMNISDEAVEAAYRANGAGGYVNKEDVRAMLEAAAQHLMAAAWDQGYKTAMFDREYYSANANPYRAAGDGE
jgi:hypothetical protein